MIDKDFTVPVTPKVAVLVGTGILVNIQQDGTVDMDTGEPVTILCGNANGTVNVHLNDEVIPNITLDRIRVDRRSHRESLRKIDSDYEPGNSSFSDYTSDDEPDTDALEGASPTVEVT